MLEANEINPNVSEDKLTMDADDEDDSKVNTTQQGEKILKGLTMEVSFILFYTLEVHHDSRKYKQHAFSKCVHYDFLLARFIIFQLLFAQFFIRSQCSRKCRPKASFFLLLDTKQRVHP